MLAVPGERVQATRFENSTVLHVSPRVPHLFHNSAQKRVGALLNLLSVSAQSLHCASAHVATRTPSDLYPV